MQITVENVGGLERKLVVQIPEENISSKVRERLNEVGRTARIDGFRIGKAPSKVVERRFGAKVREEVVGEALRTSFTEAIRGQSLRPVGDPVITSIDAAPSTGLSYSATFEVYPEVKLAPIEELEIERPECEITDADLDKMVRILQDQNKTWSPVTRPAVDGDQLIIDFQGELRGERFDGGTATDFEIVLGAGLMVAGFEEGLKGKVAGDTTRLALKFPEQYRNQQLAGQDVTFAVTVKKVSEPVLPELDDAFFEKFGVKNGGLEAFRAEVKANMVRERDRALQKRFNSHVLERLNAANTVELPNALVQNETARLQQETQQRMMMRGVDPSQLTANLAEIHASEAKNRVKLGLVMAEMIKVAEIAADPNKVRAMIESLAAGYEDPSEVLKWYYSDPRRLREIEALCLEDEAVKWIASRARANPVTISFDDLMNPGQTAA